MQALDFWMRHPDYLADELLSLYETTGDRARFDVAERIFAEEGRSDSAAGHRVSAAASPWSAQHRRNAKMNT